MKLAQRDNSGLAEACEGEASKPSRIEERHIGAKPGLTFEVSWRQRQDARPKPQKMYTVPVAGAWRLAVGARLERGVRPPWTLDFAGEACTEAAQ